jgi:hypothetical protein
MGAHNWLIVFWHDFYTSRKVMVNSTQECVLHDSSERRPGSGRPSLLSADQAPAQEQHSALSQLEGRPGNARATPSAARRGRRGVRRAVAGVAIAGAAALAWLAFGTAETAPEPADVQLAAAHVPASRTVPVAQDAPAAPAAPAAATSVPPPGGAASGTPSEVAVIQEEHPAASDPAPAAAKATRDDKQDLASLLNAPAAATAATAAAVALPAARPEKPAARHEEASRKDGARKKPASDKLAHAGKSHAPAAAAKAKAPAKAAPKHAAPAVDSDVALLAALLAHTKTPESGSAEDIFKRCATNATAAEVQRCRVRVCRSSAKDAAECKSVKLSNVAS